VNNSQRGGGFPGSSAARFHDSEFPCLLCGTGLEIRLSRKEKPYCVCNSCGIQVFFRGKTGIKRLREILEAKILIVGRESETDKALVLYNHIQQLRGRRKILEDKQGLIFRDEALDITIRAVDKEIERVQGELEKLASGEREEE
jgi:DNA-directed RNA polymerase subunit RPC12/RpoP